MEIAPSRGALTPRSVDGRAVLVAKEIECELLDYAHASRLL
jgi:hypothetical protein